MDKKALILCDTNIIVDYFRENATVRQELDLIGFARLAISAVTEAELYQGMYKKEIRATKELINKFAIIHIDKYVSQRFTQLLFEHSGGRLFIGDAFIAATALELDLQLYTQNKKDFQFIKGLRFYRPKTKLV
ncbi:type II toxin-antitoxin system VapC family toxin [Larkinella sp. VNQ87]|uniref:type II toxin-antitoxin system VapC family toxin n=1 Tax=Larkinella sp. VNQ87 TaxID=3400921 RepID=UPI003C026BA4